MKILVIRFSSLGDVVLISPLFQKIKQKYPESEITFLTSRKYVDLFSDDPLIKNIIGYDVSSENFFNATRFLRELRKDTYDEILDCQINPRSLIFLFFGRTMRRKKIDKYSRRRREMVSSHRREKIPHAVERYLSMIDDDSVNRYSTKIYLKRSEVGRVEKYLRAKTKRKIIGFAPGASKKSKMWRLSKLKTLVETLIIRDKRFLIFFGTKEEISLIKEIRKEIKDHYIDLSGKTNAKELALYLKHCDVLFTTDSGPMHVSVAVGTPVVSLFGPTVPEFGFSPFDEDSIIVSKDLSCRPCSVHGTATCPIEHHNCMEMIEVEEVRSALNKKLKIRE